MKKILLEATFLANKTYDGIPTYISSILNNLPDEYTNNVSILNLFNAAQNKKYIPKNYTEYQLNLQMAAQWIGLGGKYIPNNIQYDTFIGGSFIIPPFIPKDKEKIVIVYDTIPLKDEYLLEFVDVNNIKNVRQDLNTLLQNFLSIPKSIQIADKIITISNTVQNELNLIYHVQADKIHVVYPSIDTNFFKPTYDQSVLKKYHIIHPYFLALNVNGKFHKHADYIAHQFKQADIKDIDLIFAGNLDDDIITNLKSSLTYRFKYLGYVDKEDLPALYSNQIAYIDSVTYGGFDIPPLEALACNTTVIVPDTELHHEILGESYNVEYYILDYNNRDQLIKLYYKYGIKGKMHYDSIDKAKKFNIQNSISSFINAVF